MRLDALLCDMTCCTLLCLGMPLSGIMLCNCSFCGPGPEAARALAQHFGYHGRLFPAVAACLRHGGSESP